MVAIAPSQGAQGGAPGAQRAERELEELKEFMDLLILGSQNEPAPSQTDGSPVANNGP